MAEDPNHNLSGKKDNWVLQPSRFIMMPEVATYPWDTYLDTAGTVAIGQWHYSSHPGRMFTPATLNKDNDKFVAPIVFVDGHVQQCDFTSIFRLTPLRALEPGCDWIWYKPARQ